MPLFLLYLSLIGNKYLNFFFIIFMESQTFIRWYSCQIVQMDLCKVLPLSHMPWCSEEKSFKREMQKNSYWWTWGYNKHFIFLFRIINNCFETFQNNYSISDIDLDESEQYNNEIENEITGDTHTVTVPLTVCIVIMIGYVLYVFTSHDQ